MFVDHGFETTAKYRKNCITLASLTVYFLCDFTLVKKSAENVVVLVISNRVLSFDFIRDCVEYKEKKTFPREKGHCRSENNLE